MARTRTYLVYVRAYLTQEDYTAGRFVLRTHLIQATSKKLAMQQATEPYFQVSVVRVIA